MMASDVHRTDTPRSVSSGPPAPTPSVDWRSHLGPALVILFFNALLFLPLFKGETYSIVGAHMYTQYPWAGTSPRDSRVIGIMHTQSDHAETFYPLSVFATNAVRSGELPMWLPYNFAGVPVMELGLTGLLYPPRLAAMLVFSPIRQHDFLLVTHLLGAGLGMYGLLRLWGASPAGAAIGAIAWEANGHNAFWLTVEHVALVAAWLPVMLAAATLAVRKLSFGWSVGTAVAFSMAVFAGYVHYVYLSGLVLGSYFGASAVTSAVRCFRRRDSRKAWRALALPVVSLLLTSLLTAAYWLPLASWLNDIHRQPVSLAAQVSGSINLTGVLHAILRPSRVFGLTLPGADFSGFAFTGATSAVLALISIFRRSRFVLFGFLVAGLSLLVALGYTTIVWLMRSLLPFIGTMHLHAFFYTFCFGVTVLAAMGATELGERLGRWRTGSLLAPIVILGLIGIEARQLISVFRQVNPRHPVAQQWLFPATELTKTLQRSQGDRRIIQVTDRLPGGEWSPPVLVGKAPAALGIRSAFGYESILPVYVARLWRAVELGGTRSNNIPDAYRPSLTYDSIPLHLTENLSVGLIVAPPNVQPVDISGRNPVADGNLRLIYDGPDGRVYEDVRAVPRAHLVQNLVVVEKAEDALDRLLNPSFDGARSAIVESRDSSIPIRVSETGDSGSAAIVGDRLNRVDLRIDAKKAALLVLNDSFAPGWRAYVDGSEAPVIRANYAFRGVPVPEGVHTVVFLYRPLPFLAGCTVTVLTAIVLLVGLLVWRLRARSNRIRSAR